MSKVRIPEKLHDEQQKTDEKVVIDKPWDENEARMLRWIRYFFVGFGVIAFTFVVGIFLWHILATARWRWLSPSDLDRIVNLAVSIIVGLLISAMTTYFFTKR
jgi:hypothetical protein